MNILIMHFIKKPNKALFLKKSLFADFVNIFYLF